ncbi:hypothetical protein MTR67_022858 [Solanum verrucosum]|uniref:Uncharacterized protein n=1 Tax=Solanum verrucosum TaxID=315347 RepID=A0AAF0QU86_SOLVR|nr:hypothetical protein MTR67_022858 [Solanum verrucosum]
MFLPSYCPSENGAEATNTCWLHAAGSSSEKKREKRGREGGAISGCWLRRSCLLFAAPGWSPELLGFVIADSGQRGEAAVG